MSSQKGAINGLLVDPVAKELVHPELIVPPSILTMPLAVILNVVRAIPSKVKVNPIGIAVWVPSSPVAVDVVPVI